MKNFKGIKAFISLLCLVNLVHSALGQSISGHIENGSSTEMIYLYYYPDLMGYRDNKMKEDSSRVSNGYFHFNFDSVKFPRYARLEQKKTDSKNRTTYLGSLNLFLTNDSILIDTKDSLIDARIYNSRVNYDYLVLRELIEPIQKNIADLERKINSDYQRTPEAINSSKEYQSFTRKRLQIANKRLSDVYETYIGSFPDSWISLYAFEKRTRLNEYLTEHISRLYSKLGKHLKESELGTAFGERITKRMLLQPGAEAPVFSLPNIKGETVNLNDYRGKYVLLEFWSTTCGACRAEAPNLKEVWNKYKNEGFDIFSVSLDDIRYIKHEEWLNAIKQDGTGLWQQVCDFKGWKSSVAVTYDIKSIPQNYLIGPDGRIVSENLKGIELHDKLKEVFGF